MIIHIIAHNEVSTCGIELVYDSIRCMCYTFEKVSKTVCELYFKAYYLILLSYFYALARYQLTTLHDRYVVGLTFGNR